jgi:hypothetical protein
MPNTYEIHLGVFFHLFTFLKPPAGLGVFDVIGRRCQTLFWQSDQPLIFWSALWFLTKWFSTKCLFPKRLNSKCWKNDHFETWVDKFVSLKKATKTYEPLKYSKGSLFLIIKVFQFRFERQVFFGKKVSRKVSYPFRWPVEEECAPGMGHPPPPEPPYIFRGFVSPESKTLSKQQKFFCFCFSVRFFLDFSFSSSCSRIWISSFLQNHVHSTRLSSIPLNRLLFLQALFNSFKLSLSLLCSMISCDVNVFDRSFQNIM